MHNAKLDLIPSEDTGPGQQLQWTVAVPPDPNPPEYPVYFWTGAHIGACNGQPLESEWLESGAFHRQRPGLSSRARRSVQHSHYYCP